ncbi:hypothetical protein B0H11DRAFT_2261277 [Mycena galericulata]|nr:hypothetical protein B0H11DRAFT_2261277 [Mycena galericulata]
MSSTASESAETRVFCNTCGQTPFNGSRLLPGPEQITQLRDILRSNVSPSQPSALFHHVQGESPADLARYDAEIERVRATLSRLISERTELESYANGCRSVFSPVRRLPTEVLVEIFDMCTPPEADQISVPGTPQVEIKRLGKHHLYQLSAVCWRWYNIVMGSPRLWSTLVVDTSLWGETGTSSKKLIDALELSLKRGADFPLRIQAVVVPGNDTERLVLELLSQYCQRWKHVTLWIEPHALWFLARARGNLPLLKSLRIAAVGIGPQDLPGYDVFEFAPGLTEVFLAGWPLQLPTLPWGQLLTLLYTHTESGRLSNGLDIINHLSNHAAHRLEVECSSFNPDVILAPVFSPRLSTFGVELRASDDPNHTRRIIRGIFDCLTLPSLNTLSVKRHWKGPSLPWVQSPFVAFVLRSSLHASLTSLEIYAVIDDDELLQCLELLSSLEELIISDCADYENGHAVITDNLLRRLVWKDDHNTNLIHRLRDLCLTTVFLFDDDVLWDLVRSRLVPGRTDDGLFDIQIYCLLPHPRPRQISPQLVAQFVELENRGELHFTFEA